MDRNLHKIETALNNMATSLSRIDRNTAPIKSEASRTQSGSLFDSIPIELDWTPAAIKVKADFIKRPDGRVTIVIEVEGEDADILLESIGDLPVESLQMSAYAKR